MKRWVSFAVLSGFLTVITMGMACAPQPTPTPPPPQAPAPQAAPVVPAQAAPTISAEEAAWAKVVEAAKREGLVTIYSSAFVADVGKRLAKDFQNRYGIRVEALGGSGSMSLEKIKVERQIKQAVADVMESATGSATSLIKSGLAESIAGELPAIRDKSAFQFDPVFSPNGEAINYSNTLYGILINPKLVKAEEEPKSYRDLLDPKWKGKIISDDPRTTGGGTLFYHTLRFYKVLDLDYYRRFAGQVTIWGGASREMYRMIARGEYLISPYGTQDSVGPIVAEGAPLKLITAQEGTPSGTNVINLVKQAGHPNAGKLFINWLLSPEGQIAYNQAVGSTPFLKGLPDFQLSQLKITPTKLFPRTWEADDWANEEQKAGTMKLIFGDK